MKNPWKTLTYNQKILTASFVTTAGLTIITLWYAFATANMVKIMQAEFEISNRPYISVRSMDSNIQNGKLLYTYTLSNSGKTPAILSSTIVKGYSIDDATSKDLSRQNSATIVNPGEGMRGDLATIASDSFKQEYKIELRIKYTSPAQPKFTYETVYMYHYHGSPQTPLGIISSSMT